jgi:MazG family protein
MARLRHPIRGCPWDREQDFRSIAPYTIEEAYEVAQAIRDDDMEALKDELGDLLFQVVYHARMAEEAGRFDFDDVVAAISDKMVRRHPHVFGSAKIATSADQTEAWEAHKATERSARGARARLPAGLLDDVPLALPALKRAQKLQKRAAKVGFDWSVGAAPRILEKIEEEIGELKRARARKDAAATSDELGDLFFALVNLARHLSVDAETALGGTNEKFIRRFRHIERSLAAAGKRTETARLPAMERLWQEAKALERRRPHRKSSKKRRP